MDRPTDDLIQRLLAAAAARADQRVAELMTEAAAEAEAEVKALVKSALKAALLQRAATDLAAHPFSPDDAPADPPTPAAVAAVDEPTMDSAPRSDPAPPEPSPPHVACYVYCITRADEDIEAGPAVDPAFPVRSLAHDNVRAIVSSVTVEVFNAAVAAGGQDLAWLEQRVRAHDAVVKQALAHGPVIPLRFGTVLRGEDDVRDVLARHHDALASTLETLDGKAEWGVKVRARHGVVAEALEARDENRNGHHDSSGRNYLLGKQRVARVDGAVRRTVRSWAGTLHERLSAAAADAVILPPPRTAAPTRGGGGADREILALNSAYLVADADLETFRDTFATLAREYEPRGLVFHLSGPWPAYNFARLDLAAEAPA